jgi:hypothetical protein
MPVTRIYADFNGLVSGVKNKDRTAVVLDTVGSLQDLSNAGVILREGQPLVAFDWSDDEEDFEGHGTVQYDWQRGWWVVEFDEQCVRYVPAGDRKPVDEFLCVHCRLPFPEPSLLTAGQADAQCPSCGTSSRAPYAPPRSDT